MSAPELPAPPLGVLYDIEVYDGLLYACGELGLGRLERVAAGGWRTLSQGRANYSLEFASYEIMTTDKMENVLRTQLGIYSIN